jgi:hypothetical protein
VLGWELNSSTLLDAAKTGCPGMFCLVFDLDQVKGKLGFVLAFWKISAEDFLET